MENETENEMKGTFLIGKNYEKFWKYPTQKQKNHFYETGGMLGDCDCETDVCEHTLMFMIWKKGLEQRELEEKAKKLSEEIDNLIFKLEKGLEGFDY